VVFLPGVCGDFPPTIQEEIIFQPREGYQKPDAAGSFEIEKN
jgi:hypothetical protein